MVLLDWRHSRSRHSTPTPKPRPRDLSGLYIAIPRKTNFYFIEVQRPYGFSKEPGEHGEIGRPDAFGDLRQIGLIRGRQRNRVSSDHPAALGQAEARSVR